MPTHDSDPAFIGAAIRCSALIQNPSWFNKSTNEEENIFIHICFPSIFVFALLRTYFGLVSFTPAVNIYVNMHNQWHSCIKFLVPRSCWTLYTTIASSCVTKVPKARAEDIIWPMTQILRMQS